jgi:hypothetical protein
VTLRASPLQRHLHASGTSSGSSPLPPDGVPAESSGSPAAGEALHPLVHKLNSTLEEFPMPSFVGFIALSYGVFGASFLALNAVGFEMPALAIAGGVSRLLRWFKKPLDLTLAVALAKAFPASTSIRLGPLIIPPMPREQPREQPPAAAGPQKPGGAAANAEPAQEELLVQWTQFATRWLEGPVNQYGAPFMLARWVTGLSFVSLTTGLVHSGVDVTALLNCVFSNAESAMAVSSKASALAGAMVLNTLSLPLRVLVFAQFGRQSFLAMGLTPALPTGSTQEGRAGACAPADGAPRAASSSSPPPPPASQ